MHRTLYEIFGLPPLNMFDALANDFSDCFTTTPDFRPYQCLAVDPRIFDPKKAKDPKDPDYGHARLPSISMDDPDDMEDTLRRGAGNGAEVSQRSGTRSPNAENDSRGACDREEEAIA